MSDDTSELALNESYDSADPKETAKLRRRLRREAKEAERFWRGVFADPIGRREMWHLLEAFHTFEQRFACGPNGFPQPEATWFHAGESDAGQRLWLRWQSLDFDGVRLMHTEYDPRVSKPKPQKMAVETP